jgi:hypothetical protein
VSVLMSEDACGEALPQILSSLPFLVTKVIVLVL